MKRSEHIFIVGNSRSGTTMLMRMFDRHPEVKTINESHFMERFWKASEREHFLKPTEAIEMLLQLMSRQRDGFFAPNNEHYRAECEAMVKNLEPFDFTASEIYRSFLKHETRMSAGLVTCEKTPQHVFYIREILQFFPDARIINMVRDPRAVLASQKNKWKRRKLGSTFMPRRESIRLRVNYHPITMSQLWNAALKASDHYHAHPQVMTIRYEDLLQMPTDTVERICAFTGIDFKEKMLDIPVASSSVRADQPNERGVQAHSLEAWKQHLSDHEIRIVQQWCKAHMAKWGYAPEAVSAASLPYVISFLTYPGKMAMALAMNTSRLKDLSGAIIRRLLPNTPVKLKPA